MFRLEPNFITLITAAIVLSVVAPIPYALPAKAASAMDTTVDLAPAMGRLWEDHILFTRNYIINALAGLGDTTAVATRLLANQDDIGNAIKPYYGNAAGDALSALLKGHIVIATQVVAAAKAGNNGTLTTSMAAWIANADSIGAFLAGANPNWSESMLDSMLHAHAYVRGYIDGRHFEAIHIRNFPKADSRPREDGCGPFAKRLLGFSGGRTPPCRRDERRGDTRTFGWTLQRRVSGAEY